MAILFRWGFPCVRRLTDKSLEIGTRMTRQKSSHVDPAAGSAAAASLREARGPPPDRPRLPRLLGRYISRIESGTRSRRSSSCASSARRLGVTADSSRPERTRPRPDEAALRDAELAHRLGERLDTAEDAMLASPRRHRPGARGDRFSAWPRSRSSGSGHVAVELLGERHVPRRRRDDVRAVECLAHAHATNGDLAAALAVVTRASPAPGCRPTGSGSRAARRTS